MDIKKGARAYYADTDYKRDGTSEIIAKIDSMPAIPTPEESDAGKVIKVNDNGDYSLAPDSGTVLPVPTSEDVGKVVKVDSNEDYTLATDEGLPAVTSADNGKVLTVVNGTWSPELVIKNIDTISAMKITMSNGGANSACLPPLTFNDPATGEVANLVVNSDYTMDCSSSIVTGSMSLTGAPDVANANLPAVFDIDFINAVNIKKYSNIKMTNAVAFPYSLAKNIKIEVSEDGVSFITVYDESTLDWTVSPKEFNIYGDPVSNLPIPTIADAGKFLGVDSNGDWELGNVPNEVPTPTSADAGKVLGVDSNGDWELGNVAHPCYVYLANYNWQTGKWSLTLEQCADIVNKYANGAVIFLKGANNTMLVVDCNQYNIIASKCTASASNVTVWTVNIDPETGEGTEVMKSAT